MAKPSTFVVQLMTAGIVLWISGRQASSCVINNTDRLPRCSAGAQLLGDSDYNSSSDSAGKSPSRKNCVPTVDRAGRCIFMRF